jgi:hypothetical protein
MMDDGKMSEFSPIEYFSRLMKTWWLIVVAAFLGGFLGYLFHRARPPIYEATASYYVTIDSTKMPELPSLQYQYDEDLALAMTQAALMDQGVQSRVIEKAGAQNISIDLVNLQENSGIERKHAFWYLHYRHSDPALAQIVVNLWAEEGYKLMRAWQESKTLLDYVIFAPPRLATLPRRPSLYHQNQVVLAGALIGLLAGIFACEIWARLPLHPHQQVVG